MTKPSKRPPMARMDMNFRDLSPQAARYLPALVDLVSANGTAWRELLGDDDTEALGYLMDCVIDRFSAQAAEDPVNANYFRGLVAAANALRAALHSHPENRAR